MADLLTVIFDRAKMEDLVKLSADKIVIRATLEEGTLDNGKKAGYVVVVADAMRNGDDQPLGSIDGCPKPPCQ